MFLIFGGDIYYAQGGGNDYLGCEDTLEQAIAIAETMADCEKVGWEKCVEWAHVFDLTTKKVVHRTAATPHCYYSNRARQEEG